MMIITIHYNSNNNIRKTLKHTLGTSMVNNNDDDDDDDKVAPPPPLR